MAIDSVSGVNALDKQGYGVSHGAQNGADSKPVPGISEQRGAESDTSAFDMSNEGQKAKMGESIKALNDFLQHKNRELRFAVDDGTNKTVVSVIDSETKEVIRQIPAEEVLSIAQSIEKFLDGQGLILTEQV